MWARCYNSSTKIGGKKVNEKLKSLLEEVASGAVEVDAALEALRLLPYEDLEFAKIDHHRAIRDHIPEVVLGLGKTPEQVATIGERLVAQSGRLLVTRLDREGYRALQAAVPDVEYDELARTAVVDRDPQPLLPGVAVVCAGTSDLPVAREAATTNRVWRFLLASSARAPAPSFVQRPLSSAEALSVCSRQRTASEPHPRTDACPSKSADVRVRHHRQGGSPCHPVPPGAALP